MAEVEKDVSSFIEKVYKDIGKKPAAKQLIIGTLSGWCTGFLGMKVGKVAAVAVGGGIILLQIANYNGYVKINWNKINKNLEKISDKVEENVTGHGPNWMDKVERFVDRKIDKAEDIVKERQQKARSWYRSLGGNNQPRLRDIHLFLLSFVAGVAVGVLSG